MCGIETQQICVMLRNDSNINNHNSDARKTHRASAPQYSFMLLLVFYLLVPAAAAVAAVAAAANHAAIMHCNMRMSAYISYLFLLLDSSFYLCECA